MNELNSGNDVAGVFSCASLPFFIPDISRIIRYFLQTIGYVLMLNHYKFKYLHNSSEPIAALYVCRVMASGRHHLSVRRAAA